MPREITLRPVLWIVATLIVGFAFAWRVSVAGQTGIDGLTLEQNYPNPFSTVTEIEYALPSSGHVLLRVFNTLGQEVGRPVDDDKAGGRQAVKFDGSTLPSGQYTYSLMFTADADKSIGKLTRKMYLLR